jgi:sugar phosphate isomerase/epimerase
MADVGDPSPSLKMIADAGFSHIHWCHQWCTDFLYSGHEIDQIEKWLAEYGLKTLDLHATDGNEKRWNSDQEYRRLAGVDLVRNRIEMTARLGGDAIVMHVGHEPVLEFVRRSLDELRPLALERGIRIAVENGDNFPEMKQLLSEYEPEYVGLCYDAGHGNINDDIDNMNDVRDRLIVVHLHDNDGIGDLHNPVFSGTLDWERLAVVLAGSSYMKPLNMEVTMGNSGFDDPAKFLAHAFETGNRFSGMVEHARLDT